MEIKSRLPNSVATNTAPGPDGLPLIDASNISDVLVSVENISKKFCRNLKRSMKYGIVDLAKNLLGIKADTTILDKDEFWAIRDVSFDLKRGEILGLVGPNGCGKSTLLRMLAGIFPPDNGLISIKGRVGGLIALGAGFHPHMTGRENIYLNGSLLGLSRKELDVHFHEIVEFSEIGDFIDAPVSTYSSGMRVRLGFSIASQLEPDILLIDEVLAVGDMGFRGKCINAIDKLTKNAAVIFVSHQMSEVARLCSKIMVLNSGKPHYQGNDVSRGIEAYYSQMGSIGSSTAGSGRGRIHAIELGTEPAAPVDEPSDIVRIPYLGDCSIDITFSLDSAIEQSIMNIAFFTRDMKFAAQVYSNNCNFDILNTGEIKTVRVKIPSIPLNPGIYFISINLLDQHRGELFVRLHAGKMFQVVGPLIGNAPVQLQGTWSYV